MDKEFDICTQDILGEDTLTPDDEFVNSENGTYSNQPICQKLFNSTVPISEIVHDLTSSQTRFALLKILDSTGIKTIGDFSKLTHIDLIQFPIYSPKYPTACQVLHEYLTRIELTKEKTSSTIPYPVPASTFSQKVMQKVIRRKAMTCVKAMNINTLNKFLIDIIEFQNCMRN